ncbi:MAG: polysaccharide biosynthesis C-terminal domain-containing protein [Oscillospiraceae bacterium]|nr:polysaccharide biosynthesis C-terminal domain-containing protein [Oscillospiraceae bacterium]
MSKKLPIFYSALLLTGVNLLLRLVGTSFQVYLSGRIGAEGIGLLQLTMSVGSMAMVAGMAGIRTATMYLTAEELGRGRPKNVTWVLSSCVLYSIVCSCVIGSGVYQFAPAIADKWIGNVQIVPALRLFAVFLPVSCLSGVMTGYFTGANRIGTLAAVEVAEQLFCMVCTVTLLTLWAGHDPGKACQSVVLGSCLGGSLTLICLITLRLLEHPATGRRIKMGRRLADTAVPLAIADDLRTGISTVENLMVPKRLALYPGTTSALADFGTVSGMVFPVLMFPAAILFGLTELLIPELARCRAAGSEKRIRYLVSKSLRVALLYGCTCGGILYLTAKPLSMQLYSSKDAGRYLTWFSLLAIMLYCDLITDAMIKGLGQQKASVRYNIITNVMDVAFLFVLLPRYGITGYFISFLVTHAINFILSLRRLFLISGVKIPFYIPAMTLACTGAAILASSFLTGAVIRAVAFVIILVCLLFLCKVVSRQDIIWVKGVVRKK